MSMKDTHYIIMKEVHYIKVKLSGWFDITLLK